MSEQKESDPHEVAIREVWKELLSDLELPDRMKRRISHFEEAVGRARAEEIYLEFRGRTESNSRHGETGIRERLSEVLIDVLRLKADDLTSEASKAHVEAASLRNQANRLDESDTPDGQVTVGENLAWIRESLDRTQAEFAAEELQGCIARSTYAKLESGKAASIKVSTLEEIAAALGINFRLLLLDENTLESLIQLLVTSIGYNATGERGPVVHEVWHTLRGGKRELTFVAEKKGMDNLSVLTPQLEKWLVPSRCDSFSFRVGVRLGWMRGGHSKSMEAFVDQIEENMDQIEKTKREGNASHSSEAIYRITGAVLVGHWSRGLQN